MKNIRMIARLGILCMFGTPAATQAALAAGENPHHDSASGAKEALESLRGTYVSGNLDGFLQQVSERSHFPIPEFKTRLASDFTALDQIELHIVVDHVLTEGQKTVLKTHWQKRAVRRGTGNVEKSDGKAHFVFVSEPEGLRLLDIQHDSPF